ncbi:DUF6443 domain-containing protein [Cyclobacterium jeungdonense]|uniref:DUF6443 domain-containing protein n=1 Tax=Cyclobacterium jeungdonense TaxID=708087 RepID=A0ABT8CB03_9BACT|nr:DUF6443 domain-containing protein [Cyclobacterium jeungdonense]MDN3689144.1 DUF6443 domain-containing protein [Cyclobacterium jeungdonense]
MKTKLIYLAILTLCSWTGRPALAQENSIRTFRPEVPLKATSSLEGSPSVKISTVYLDGLGREQQIVSQGAAPGGGDIVKPKHYDSFGRPDREYLPYVPIANKVSGAFRPDFEAEHASYYHQKYAGDAYGYQEIVYQPSDLLSPQTISPPGKAWRPGSGRETTFHERPNLAEEQVRIWTVNGDGLPLTKESYAAGELWVSIITDGEGIRSLIYTDKLGREILKKTQARPNPSEAHAGWHCTYYIYDMLGDLRVVLPPKAVEILSDNWQRSRDMELAEGLYFLYRFDGIKRLVEKKIPGKAREQFLYDDRDRLVGSRDGNLKLAGQWRYTKYDAHNRPVQTGITNDKRKRETLQNDLDPESSRYLPAKPEMIPETYGKTFPAGSSDWQNRYQALQTIALKPGFHFEPKGIQSFPVEVGTSSEETLASEPFPREEGEILSLTYYDDYHNSKRAFQEKGVGISSLPASGLSTGKLVKNMASGQLMETVVHYDEMGRAVLTLSENHLGGEIENSIQYDFRSRPLETQSQIHGSVALRYTDRYHYSPEGYLIAIYRRMAEEPETLLASYSYGLTGQMEEKHLGGLATFQYERHIRGWTNAIRPRSADTSLFSMTLTHETGPQPLFNGNISEMVWSGRDQQHRTYRFDYDPAGRLTEASYSVPGKNSEKDRYSLRGMRYDTNGNLLSLTRHNKQGKDSFGEVDRLSYRYAPYSNLLENINDDVPDAGFSARDFSAAPSRGNYRYDANGNLTANPYKGIHRIRYNHLDLPEEMVFDSGEKILFAYSAEGQLLYRKLEKNGKMMERTDQLGELVLADGKPRQLLHPEGRAVWEKGKWVPEFFIRDHLGNVRQVLRKPVSTIVLASMEPGRRNEENKHFEGVDQTRQAGEEHNSTPGGSHSAWLNADRGRMLGPARRQKVAIGEQLRLSVRGKYRDSRGLSVKPETFIASGAKNRLLDNLTEFGNAPAAAGNPVLWLSLADLLIKELQTKPVPEAYLLYVLYDSEGKLYRQEKRVLSKKAAGKHEFLATNFYIEKAGYLEAFLVNETETDVWFDDFRVQTLSPLVVQEDHYDPWGLELSGLEYREEDREKNNYKFNAGSLLLDRLGWYQTPNRLYDPVLGRFWGMDKLSDMYTSISPMAFGFNNPLLFSDPTGLAGDCDGCPEFQLPVVTINSSPNRRHHMQLESQLQLMRQSRNPVYRNLGQTAYREGLQAARDLYQRGRKLHFSEKEALASRNSRYLDGIGKMVSHGITGSMVAAVASPVLVRGVVEGLGARVVQRMGMEVGLQMGMSLLFNGNLKSVDVADIGLAGLFGKSAFFSQALFDINLKDGFSSSIGIGNQKRISETTLDLGVGGFNFGHNKLLNSSEIDKRVVSIISNINSTARILTGKVSTNEY